MPVDLKVLLPSSPSYLTIQLACLPTAHPTPHLPQSSLLVEVVVEDTGRAWVCEDVGIALLQVVAGEGPVVQRAAGVVVVNKLRTWADTNGGQEDTTQACKAWHHSNTAAQTTRPIRIVRWLSKFKQVSCTASRSNYCHTWNRDMAPAQGLHTPNNLHPPPSSNIRTDMHCASCSPLCWVASCSTNCHRTAAAQA